MKKSMPTWLLPTLLFAGLLEAGTAKKTADDTGIPFQADPVRKEAPLAAYPTLEALVEDAVARLNARDTAALERMSFGREEFLAAYPFFESDTSRTRREFACGFYIGDNRKILARRLEQEGGKSLEVSRIEVEGMRIDREAFRLCRGLKVWVRDGDREFELRFLKSAARTAAGWKIWSFEDD
jgi:hypothetical protein